jgi:hypothetical protein
MAHLFLLVSYAAISILVSTLDILISYRVIKDMKDVFFYYIAIGQDGVVIAYVIIGLFFAVWAFWGMPTEDKKMFCTIFYVLAALLAVSSGTVLIGLEDIIWRNPGEFIDLTWLFELVTLGYHTLKWVIVLSYTISLEEMAQDVPSGPSRTTGYQLVSVPQHQESNIQMVQFMPNQEPKKVWTLPVQFPGYMQ